MKSSVLFVGVLALCVGSSLAKVQLDPTQWNYDTGLTFCLYSYAAYCPSSQIQSWNCSRCQHNSTVSDFQTTSIVTSMDELAYIGFNSEYKQIIVSFRGSTNLKNWIQNLKFIHTLYPYCDGCKVHKGFWEVWQSMKDQVMRAVSGLHRQHSNYDIIATGHSMGAALATLASVDIQRNVSGTVPVYAWNLGSPRVGNAQFADWYRNSSGIAHSQRIVNWKDIVPHLPFKDMRFRHVVQEVWEQKDPNTFRLCADTNGDDPSCSDSVGIPYSIDDHLNYFGLSNDCI